MAWSSSTFRSRIVGFAREAAALPSRTVYDTLWYSVRTRRLRIKLTPPTALIAAPLPPARARRRWQEADHEQRRDLIIQTALDLLRRHGLQHVTIRRVAHRLGVGAMTLYTYIQGQAELQRAMIRRGFELLHSGCQNASTLETDGRWRPGAKRYLQFAIENPRLYELMFSTPIPPGDHDLLPGGFQHLLDKVRMRLADRGMQGEELEQQTRQRAGRFWIALHGLASLAIAGRLAATGTDAETLLEDLLERVAPG